MSPERSMTRIAVNGAAGRMGRMVLAGVLLDEGLKLVAATDRPSHPNRGADAGQLCGKWTTGIALDAPRPGIYADADVVVDFSLAEGSSELLGALEGQALVMGTTGLSPEQLAGVQAHGQRAPVVLASNFSTGVNLLMGLVARAAQLLPDYDVEIVEMHHRHKRDAPSGTALSLGQAVAQGRGEVFDSHAVYGRHGMLGPREPSQIGLHALRGGDIAGEHTVYLAGAGERLVLGHLSTSREAFATGALRAARWVVARPPGLYDMVDVLGLRS
jgi:4-hydroxy-tetrahydrodipicolinate reductase